MFMFVYGTLKRDWWNNELLRNAEFIGEFLTEERYNLLRTGAIPVMVPGEHAVKGEIFRVDDDEILALVDRLEGHPHGYRRQDVQVRDFHEPVQGYIGNSVARLRHLVEVPLTDDGFKEYGHD